MQDSFVPLQAVQCNKESLTLTKKVFRYCLLSETLTLSFKAANNTKTF